jgi:hypothetical protein
MNNYLTVKIFFIIEFSSHKSNQNIRTDQRLSQKFTLCKPRLLFQNWRIYFAIIRAENFESNLYNLCKYSKNYQSWYRILILFSVDQNVMDCIYLKCLRNVKIASSIGHTWYYRHLSLYYGIQSLRLYGGERKANFSLLFIVTFQLLMFLEGVDFICY